LCFDVLVEILHKKLPISAIRVKKFCTDTMFEYTNIQTTAFKPPMSLTGGLARAIKYKFINKIVDKVFYTK
jgi:hypothetical protein